MKKVLFPIVLLLSVALAGCADKQTNVLPAEQGMQQSEESHETEKKEVISLVENFGKKLQLVSLLAPEETVRESMQEHYADFVTPSLLEKWQRDPLNAPGRLTSSPWPDRIEVQTVEKISEDTYRVKGKIIEITSVEQETGEAAAKRPITLEVRKIGERWLIDAVELGEYESGNQTNTGGQNGGTGGENPDKPDSVVYENTEYGFRFSLPKSWKGYTIVQDKWEGLSLEESQSGKTVASGPVISIRHPEWTKDEPRQDIPIMVLTLDQWNSLQQGKFHIGAAPVGPNELGRNSRYVFALPARYNFAFPKGYEEVENILNNHPLQPVDVNATDKNTSQNEV